MPSGVRALLLMGKPLEGHSQVSIIQMLIGCMCVRRLPSHPILPLGLSDASGTTSLFATYLTRAPGWKLGMGTSLAWPRCVRHTIEGSNGMVSGVHTTAYSVG